MVANFYCGDSATYGLYNTGTFMAIHSWKRSTPSAIRIGNITVADCNSRKFDFHLTRTSVSECHFFNDKWLTKFATNCCFHNG